METIIANYIALAAFAIAWIGFGIMAVMVFRRRKGDRSGNILAPVALAGSGEGPRMVKLLAPSLYNGETRVKTPHGFKEFVVKGNSMMLCGIKENDIILTEAVNDSFPCPSILLLRRTRPGEGEAEYKLRRTWAVCDTASKAALEDTLTRILSDPQFQAIKSAKEYPGDAAIIADFWDVRFKLFEKMYSNSQRVIISTTLHNNFVERGEAYHNKIMFSIHPYSAIAGKVVGTYRKKSPVC